MVEIDVVEQWVSGQAWFARQDGPFFGIVLPLFDGGLAGWVVFGYS